MLSRADSRKKAGGVSGNGKLLRDLETLGKAFNADKTLQRLTSSTASSRAKSVGKSHVQEPKMKPGGAKNYVRDSTDREKKSSIWSWKGLKALTHVRNHRFNCRFSLQVHSINGLPPMFDDVCLVVHWKRQDGEHMTSPIRVCKGVAEFEEQLTLSCSVYGSTSGPHHSVKYEAKHCLLYVSVYDAPELDLGKHRIDLTRLFPITLEELDEEESSGKWTTSFRLSGKARGATINVCFRYVIDNNNAELSCGKNISEIVNLQQNGVRAANMSTGQIYKAGSLPTRLSASKRSVEDIKDLHEVLPMLRSELRESGDILFQKMDEDMYNASFENKLEADSIYSRSDLHILGLSIPCDASEMCSGTECEVPKFSVKEKGLKESEKHVKPDNENQKIAQASGDGLEDEFAVGVVLDSVVSLQHSPVEIYTCKELEKESDMDSKESPVQDLELPSSSTTDPMNEKLDSKNDETDALGNYMKVNSNCGDRRKGKSLSLDDVTDSVASDFLNMLGLEHSPYSFTSESEPESPRERLLRQFEKDTLANGGLLDFDIENDPAEQVSNIPTGSAWGTTNDFYHPLTFEGFKETSKRETDAFCAKTRASRIEGLETEALMQEWGLNEKAFRHSPPGGSTGFSNPIDIPPEDHRLLPPLAEGLGPIVQTKGGGFLRSINPALFKNAKSGGNLIMQVSNPVVVPAEMGSGVMDILQGLASVGIEKLSRQAKNLMPLEDIIGKTMQQISWEGLPSLDGLERQYFTHQESEIRQNIRSGQKSVKGISPVPKSNSFRSDSEYVALEDLAPLAMDKIEALSIEGLRIQSGMSDEDAPSNISAQSIGEFSALRGKTLDVGGSIGLDGTCGLQLMNVKDNGEDVDGLMGLSLTLDEWMKLDSGEIDDDDLVSERTSKILAAHHATSLDQFRGRSKGEKRRGRSKKYGLLGNNFTVALMVQLCDPLRDYEPVGTPMLALIQVERVFIPPKPKIYSTVSAVRSSNEDEVAEGAEKENIIEKPNEDKFPEDELIPQVKITEVHVAGLKAEQGKNKLWGSTNQQQSGSRWLLANGMGKKNKHPIMKSKVVAKSCSAPTMATVQHGETLWSISSRANGNGTIWKELEALGTHIRNPNVILPKGTLRLR